ncbi:MAG: AAA family ATPase [Microcoleus sp.]
MEIKRAERKKAKLRIGLFGPSGSGKTTGALRLAHGLCGDWTKICVIDTEHQSASLYADMGEYNVLELEAPYSPERYIQAIEAAQNAGMEVIIIDSITHEWGGKGGVLEIHEQVTRSSPSGNSYTAWSKVTPRHNAFIDVILSSKCHVICCSRTKDEVVMTTNSKGKESPQKVGLKAVTRDGFDYEMTLCFDVSITHQVTASKDRTRLYMDQPDLTLTEASGEELAKWADSGTEDLAPQPGEREQIMAAAVALFDQLGWDKPKRSSYVLEKLRKPSNELTIGQLRLLPDHLRAELAAKGVANVA